MDEIPRGPQIEELVEWHYVLIYRYAYRLTGSHADAEDLTQHTFLTAQARLNQLREPESAKSWLCAIARNSHLKSLRGRSGSLVVSLDDVAEPAGALPEDLPIDEEVLQQALNELPEEFRSTLILYYFEEFTYKEIAAQLEVPIGTVMSRLARGKAYLRGRLAACVPVGTHE